MRTFAFAKRNLKEIIRDPLSLIFCFIFPIGLFLILQFIMMGVGADMTATPQFAVENMFSSICIFGFTFLTLFSSMLISRDRRSSFQARLNASPLRPHEAIIGYTLALLPIALIQIVLTLGTAFCFGLPFTWNILLSIFGLLPSLFLFIGIGILIGTLFNEKAVGGICSLIINIAVLLGGMFFPLQIMTGALPIICNCLPFAPGLTIVRNIILGDFTKIWIPIVTVLAYMLVIFVLAVFAFYKKSRSDEK